MVTHLSTNQSQHGATLLMHPTLLPFCQAASLFDECRLSAEVAANPRPSQPTWTASQPEGNGSYRPHPPSPFYYYSARALILTVPQRPEG